MALSDFLYRCPGCGALPTRNGNGGAECDVCGRRYLPGRAFAHIREVEPDGRFRDLHAWELARRIEELGGPFSSEPGGTGEWEERCEVVLRRAVREEPVRYRGSLLGFVERFGPREEGALVLNSRELLFRLSRAPSGRAGRSGEAPELAWALDAFQALQSSSSSVQFSPGEGGVVLLRFPKDSTRRWEDLLRTALQNRWSDLGRGTIIEFQPRIRTR